ncbi:MAG: Mur ligase family protein, partial [Candidatus Eisenbacteria bacterium]
MLGELLDGVEMEPSAGALDVEVSGIAHDSRRVRPGDAFFALAGARTDGARYVRDAIAAGARVVVGAPGVSAAGVPVVAVPEPRLALARAACRLHGDPSRAMTVVAVTGTNGKTTTTWMLESVFRAAGRTTGLLGTIGVRFGGTTRASAFTTPEAPELQALLAEMRDAGVQAVAMEVSSHALAQRRTWGLAADVCVFTNLTQDHLDFHHTMDAYLDAKLMLFDGRNGGAGKRAVAVINDDDPAAAKVRSAATRGGLAIRGFRAGLDAALADLRVVGIEPQPGGLKLRVAIDQDPARPDAPRSGGGTWEVRLALLGRYNA